MIISVDIGHDDILENFPNFDITQCKYPEKLDFRRWDDNLVGQQQRAWIIYNCIKEFEQSRGVVGLEIGCGQAHSPFVLATDKSYTKFNEEYGGGEYHPQLQCRGEKLPFTDESFPFLIACHCLEHMDNTLETLKEWIRVLKKGGHLYIIMPDEKYPHYPEDKTHKCKFTAEEFKEFILEHLKNIVTIIEHDSFANHFSFNVVLQKI